MLGPALRHVLLFARGLFSDGLSLSIGTIADGDYLRRSGNEIIGDTVSGGGAPSAHASTHQNGGADEIATATPGANAIPKANSSGKLDGWVSAASTSTTGLVQLATSGETAAAKAVTATDSRLSDARTPVSHASSHLPDGSDPLGLPGELAGLIYGWGRDGDLVFDGSSSVVVGGTTFSPSAGVYTVQSAILAANVTISGSCQINTGGHIFRVSGTLTNLSGDNIIRDDGNAGGVATGGSGLSGLNTTLARSSSNGGAGRITAGTGANGQSQSRSNAGRGGAGGTAGANAGGSGGGSTGFAASEVGFYGPLAVLVGQGSNGAGAPGTIGLGCGTGGGAGGVSGSGASGSGGGGGGFVDAHALAIVVTAGTLTFRAAGGAGSAATSGVAGGGGGGGGGMVQVICRTLTGTPPTLSAAGGVGGAGFGGGANGDDGSAGRTRLVVGSTVTVS